MISGIYKITNSVNGKFYIGSSKDINYRWDEHKQYLNGGYHINPKLQNAWNFYGGDKFLFEVVEETAEEVLLIREQHYLDLFKPYMRDIGYNICPTACGGDNITYHPDRDGFIEKMRGICSGEGNPMFGRKHTDDSIKLQKEKSVGRFTMEWFCKKYGDEVGLVKYNERKEKLKSRDIDYSYDNGFRGKKRTFMTEEVKKSISDSKKKMKLNRENIHKDIKNGSLTLKEISDKYNISKTTILREKRKLNTSI